jgi:hypothetical protein
MMSLRFVLSFCSQSCLQSAARRGCRVGLMCQSHIHGARAKKTKKTAPVRVDVAIVYIYVNNNVYVSTRAGAWPVDWERMQGTWYVIRTVLRMLAS